jgi:uncharacterized membrane protein YoaK (UPF0700 family)
MPRNVERLLPVVLSTTAGAVDIIGFLALGGLFTAHITGNLVVLAAHLRDGRVQPDRAVAVSARVHCCAWFSYRAVCGQRGS